MRFSNYFKAYKRHTMLDVLHYNPNCRYTITLTTALCLVVHSSVVIIIIVTITRWCLL